jgi:flagellin-like hook-associated protein FlgL
VELIGENARPMAVQVGLNAADYIEVPLKSCTVEDLNLAATKTFANTSGAAVQSFSLSQTTTSGIGSIAGGVGSSDIKITSTGDIADVKFTSSPLPQFRLSIWDGSRLDDGTTPSGKTVDLTAGPVASLSDLVAQLKSHSNYDPTVCDLQNVNGKLTVVWKIQGLPSAPYATSLSVVNAGSSAATSTNSNVTVSGGVAQIKTVNESSAESTTKTQDGVTYRPQLFTFPGGSTGSPWFVAPGPDNHFELRIGSRSLSADNVTSASDLAQKLAKDSDYSFVLQEAGLPENYQMFNATNNSDGGGTLEIRFGQYATQLGTLRKTTNNITIAETDKAITALDFIDKAADVVNDRRARMGATMSRIEYTINNLMNVVQNTEEAKSRILDTDYAAESAALAKAQVLAQAGTAMLAQANQSQQYVLNLLKGM